MPRSKNFDLEIEDGEFFVLLGPTGAGKTTTLRLIAGLEKPDAGTIEIDHENIAEWGAAERDVALVLQQYSLYPRFTVRENLEFPAEAARRDATQARDRRAGRPRLQDRARRPSPRPQDGAAVGRRNAARLDRPCHRAQSPHLPDGRAALEPRRQAARGTAGGAQGPARPSSAQPSCSSRMTRSRPCPWATASPCSIGGSIVQIGTPQEIYNKPCNVFVAGFVGSPAMNLFPAEMADGKAIVVPGEMEIALRGPRWQPARRDSAAGHPRHPRRGHPGRPDEPFQRSSTTSRTTASRRS